MNFMIKFTFSSINKHHTCIVDISRLTGALPGVVLSDGVTFSVEESTDDSCTYLDVDLVSSFSLMDMCLGSVLPDCSRGVIGLAARKRKQGYS